MKIQAGAAAFAAMMISLVASAQTAEKAGFGLGNPTPDALLRPYVPDRPNKALGPTTIDAGRFAFETDIVNHVRDKRRSDGTDFKGWSAGNILLRAGLTQNIELGIATQAYVSAKSRPDGGRGAWTGLSGVGDVFLKPKIALLGNDGGAVQVALIPILKLPTAKAGIGNKSFEGSLVLPIGFTIGNGFTAVFQTEVDMLRKPTTSGYAANFVNALNVSRAIAPNLTASVEIFTSFTGADDITDLVTIDTALAYMVSDNVYIDAGINWGLNRDAADFNPYIGFGVRF
jgi:hypothetical protein